MPAEWNWTSPVSYHYPFPLPEGADLTQRLSQAEQKVNRLSERLDQAERLLEEIKNRAPMHVEYHFDQLKVNELKGTLNVGLSPQGAQGIDSLETPQNQWTQTGPAAAGTESADRPFSELTQQMETYVDQEAPAILSGLEQQFGVMLDEAHRLRLLADVKGQLKERVHYYARISPYPPVGAEQERRVWRQSVIDRTARDIHDALTSYMDKWIKRTKGQGGASS